MFGRNKISSSVPLDKCPCHSSGCCGIVETVPLSLNVIFSCDNRSLLKKKKTVCSD